MKTTCTERDERDEPATRSDTQAGAQDVFDSLCGLFLYPVNYPVSQGYAYTFITEDQVRYAGDIIKALELSGASVPPELEQLWASFKDQQKAVNRGYAQFFCSQLF